MRLMANEMMMSMMMVYGSRSNVNILQWESNTRSLSETPVAVQSTDRGHPGVEYGASIRFAQRASWDFEGNG